MSQVTDAGLLQEAIAELYSCDPGEFIERRSALAARARTAGEPDLAKKIAALRKPTRSAWILNQLVRSAPEVTTQLAALGDELRAAQRSLDGAAIRELSVRRRQLMDALTRQAFALSGQQSPPAIKDEVTATLGAALADPQFNEQLRAGALDRAARRDGFGPAGIPELVLLSSSPGLAQTPAATGAPAPGTRAPRATAPAAARAGAEQKRRRPATAAAQQEQRRAIAAAEQERRRQATAAAEQDRRRQAIAAAEQALAEADQAASAAASAEQAADSAVRLIEKQLTEARTSLADARLRTRRASTRQRQARQALDQLQQHPPRASG
jgi:hypothetical protein